MENDELKRQIKEIWLSLAAMERVLVEQQQLALESMAFQHAHLAVLRDLLSRMGADRSMLRQQIQESYRTARKMYLDRLKSAGESGGAYPPPDFPILPDETLGN